jgi:3-dehydroquinate synthase
MYKVIKQDFSIRFNYDIFFTENIFYIKNNILINILNSSAKKKVIIFVDKQVLKLHKNLISNIFDYFDFFKLDASLVCAPISVPGGERLKNRYLYLKIFYSLIEKYGICRQSYIISIGGGSLQDFIGYLASTSHRGVN